MKPATSQFALFSFTTVDDNGTPRALHRRHDCLLQCFNEQVHAQGGTGNYTATPDTLKKGDIVAVDSQWMRVDSGAVHRNGVWTTLF